jgi:hypothetical protein
MALDVWVLPSGALPYVERAHEYEHVAELSYDGYFVFLRRFAEPLEADFRFIDYFDECRFEGELLSKLRVCLSAARAEAQQREDAWLEPLGKGAHGEQSERLCDTVERARMIELLDRLLNAAERAQKQSKSLLFFGD